MRNRGRTGLGRAEKVRLADVLSKAGREAAMPDATVAPPVNMVADACVAKECAPAPRPSPLEQRAKLMALYGALQGSRDVFSDYRAYEACATLEREIAGRLGELELKGR